MGCAGSTLGDLLGEDAPGAPSPPMDQALPEPKKNRFARGARVPSTAEVEAATIEEIRMLDAAFSTGLAGRRMSARTATLGKFQRISRAT